MVKTADDSHGGGTGPIQALYSLLSERVPLCKNNNNKTLPKKLSPANQLQFGYRALSYYTLEYTHQAHTCALSLSLNC